MADFSKRGPGCDDTCDGEGGERGERGKRGQRGHRGHDGHDGRDGRDGHDGDIGATGPTGPAGTGDGGVVVDPTPPTLTGNGTDESPLQVINVAPQPFTSPLEKRIIFVRADGSDEDGDGLTEETAFRTVQHAVLDVPMFIPGGVQYIVDCTGLIDGGPEILPPHYQLPPWKAGRAFDAGDFSDPQFFVQTAVNIRAELRDAQALGVEAIVNFEDLEPTDVGGGISNVTVEPDGTIVITTNMPHGLFLVQDDFIQQVTITGVTGVPSANGTFFVEVLTPTSFFLKDVDGTGEGPFTGGGTVTTLFVQDQTSGQIQVKLSASRGSWMPGTLKGLVFLAPSGENSVIFDNTSDTLSLTQVFPLGIAPDSPGRIVEQSAELRCSPATTFGFIGGFNAINQNSLALDGLIISTTNPEDVGLFHMYGNVWVQGCKLTNPWFTRTTQANSGFTHMMNPEYSQTPIYQSSGLFEGGFYFGLNWWECFGGTVVIAPFVPLGIMDDGGFLGWFGVKIIDAEGDAFSTTAPHGFVNRLSIENGGGNAVVIDGQGRIIFNGVGGNWAGEGLVVLAGGQAEVTEASFNDAFSAGPNTMLVGILPVRTFAGFRGTPPDGGEIHNQFDVQSFNAPGFGAVGTGSRVFQEPYPAP